MLLGGLSVSNMRMQPLHSRSRAGHCAQATTKPNNTIWPCWLPLPHWHWQSGVTGWAVLQVMDFGYPQFTEAKILSEYIKTDAHKMEVSMEPLPLAYTPTESCLLRQQLLRTAFSRAAFRSSHLRCCLPFNAALSS